MRVAIPREIVSGETRVAAVPETVKRFVAGGAEVWVEAGAGAAGFFPDSAYQSAGAKVEPDAAALFGKAGLVLKVARPNAEASAGRDELALLPGGSLLVAMLEPLADLGLVERLAGAGVTSFSLDMMPRISRAQAMDVLSSMSTLAGYKAVLMAANALGKMFPMMMTAAGTIAPARVLVIGAGVAGLQAIATARRLGAVVRAVDTRPVVKEQVESLGAQFATLEVEHAQAEDVGGYARDLGEEFYRQEQESIATMLKGVDVVVTTAAIPGRAAPLLITEAMVKAMKSPAVIVDLAAPSGGNCTLSRPGQEIVKHGVTIIAPLNLAASMPAEASTMYSRNMAAFVGELVKDGEIRLDTENEIIAGCMITHAGEVTHAAVRDAIAARRAQP